MSTDICLIDNTSLSLDYHKLIWEDNLDETSRHQRIILYHAHQ